MKQFLFGCVAVCAASLMAAIDADTAAKAALTHAGVSAVADKALSVVPEMDDGKLRYEVRFHDGTSSYEYEIDGASGAVLESSRKALPVIAQPKSKEGISDARALAIALSDANIKDVPSRTKVRREIEDGRPVYEVEFDAGDMEYEYTIDAESGMILERDCERDSWLPWR